MPSIAWVALGGDIAYGVLPLHEVGDREEHIPSYDSSIEETMGQAREEAHIISVRIGISGVQRCSWRRELVLSLSKYTRYKQSLVSLC